MATFIEADVRQLWEEEKLSGTTAQQIGSLPNKLLGLGLTGREVSLELECQLGPGGIFKAKAACIR